MGELVAKAKSTSRSSASGVGESRGEMCAPVPYREGCHDCYRVKTGVV